MVRLLSLKPWGVALLLVIVFSMTSLFGVEVVQQKVQAYADLLQ